MGRRSVAAWVGAALAFVAGPACQKKETIVTPALSATCEARPASGEAPLAVSFVLGVSGAEGPFTVSISYGDGATGTNPDLPHTYATAGTFTASFEVATATQSARCATPVAVTGGRTSTPPPSSNQMPDAVFKSTPDAVKGQIAGTAPLAVRFNMCATTDPERDTIYFRMDFDGDGRWEVNGTTGGACRRDHTYVVGTYDTVNCLADVGPSLEPLHPDQCRHYTVKATP
jgi:PKD repeat protein